MIEWYAARDSCFLFYCTLELLLVIWSTYPLFIMNSMTNEVEVKCSVNKERLRWFPILQFCRDVEKESVTVLSIKFHVLSLHGMKYSNFFLLVSWDEQVAMDRWDRKMAPWSRGAATERRGNKYRRPQRPERLGDGMEWRLWGRVDLTSCESGGCTDALVEVSVCTLVLILFGGSGREAIMEVTGAMAWACW